MDMMDNAKRVAHMPTANRSRYPIQKAANRAARTDPQHAAIHLCKKQLVSHLCRACFRAGAQPGGV